MPLLPRIFARHMSTRYGFIGLGRMGFPMCSNLRDKVGRENLIVNDINLDVASTLGVKVDTASKVVESSLTKKDIIITMLPETRHVESVFSEVLKLPVRGKLFIDCSTIDPAGSVALSKEVASKEADFIDAPVSGGVVGASAATLTFMVGGDAEKVKRITPVLEIMGKRILHCGGPGAGLAGKLANNYLLAISNIASAEAMNLGIKLGLEPKVLAGLINVSSGRCWSSDVNNCVPGVIETAPASREYEGGFGVGLMRKDLGLAITAAELAGAKLELSAKAMEVYQNLESDPEYKGRDFSVVYKKLNRS